MLTVFADLTTINLCSINSSATGPIVRVSCVVLLDCTKNHGNDGFSGTLEYKYLMMYSEVLIRVLVSL